MRIRQPLQPRPGEPLERFVPAQSGRALEQIVELHHSTLTTCPSRTAGWSGVTGRIGPASSTHHAARSGVRTTTSRCDASGGAGGCPSLGGVEDGQRLAAQVHAGRSGRQVHHGVQALDVVQWQQEPRLTHP